MIAAEDCEVDGFAVLVIDFQVAFTTGAYPIDDGEGLVAKASAFLNDCRALGIPIIQFRVAYSSASEVGPVWSRKNPLMKTLIDGSPEAELATGIGGPTDRVIRKKRASAFFGTDLKEILESAGVTSLVVIGSSTSGCVRASVVDAASLDYSVVVLEDLVGDRHVSSHLSALYDIRAKYGDVVQSRTFLSAFAREAPFNRRSADIRDSI